MIRGLLLAGGASTRFGSAKLLHPYEGARSLGEAAAATLLESLGNALAIVRDGDGELAARLRALGCEVLETPRARGGLGDSIAAGVDASPDAQAWVVALADMPRIAPATIRAVRDALAAGALLAAPRLPTGERGHPVGFGASLRSELAALSGDEGARSILRRHAGEVRLVEVADPGILYDVDTPRDLAGRS